MRFYSLREQKQKAQVETTGRDELRKRIDDMSTFLREQTTTLPNTMSSLFTG